MVHETEKRYNYIREGKKVFLDSGPGQKTGRTVQLLSRNDNGVSSDAAQRKGGDLGGIMKRDTIT